MEAENRGHCLDQPRYKLAAFCGSSPSWRFLGSLVSILLSVTKCLEYGSAYNFPSDSTAFEVSTMSNTTVGIMTFSGVFYSLRNKSVQGQPTTTILNWATTNPVTYESMVVYSKAPVLIAGLNSGEIALHTFTSDGVPKPSQSVYGGDDIRRFVIGDPRSSVYWMYEINNGTELLVLIGPYDTSLVKVSLFFEPDLQLLTVLSTTRLEQLDNGFKEDIFDIAVNPTDLDGKTLALMYTKESNSIGLAEIQSQSVYWKVSLDSVNTQNASAPKTLIKSMDSFVLKSPKENFVASSFFWILTADGYIYMLPGTRDGYATSNYSNQTQLLQRGYTLDQGFLVSAVIKLSLSNVINMKQVKQTRFAMAFGRYPSKVATFDFSQLGADIQYRDFDYGALPLAFAPQALSDGFEYDFIAVLSNKTVVQFFIDTIMPLGCLSLDPSKKFARSCESCEANFSLMPVLNRTDGTEVQGCLSEVCNSTHQFLDVKGTCGQRCSSGYFFDGTRCKTCDPLCKTCTINSTTCTSCIAGQVLAIDSTCRFGCPTGQYFDPELNRCFVCPDNCMACIYKKGQIPTCTGCKPNLRLDNGNCSTVCTKGFYLGTNGTCQACDKTCATCTKGTGLDCTDCAAGFVFYYRSCLSNCPRGTWFDNVKNKCVDCPQYCEACASTTSCTSCSDGFLQHGPGGLCSAVNRCNTGRGFYIANDQFCLRCPENCATCSGKTCQSCLEGYTLRFGSCWEPDKDRTLKLVVLIVVGFLFISTAVGCFIYYRINKAAKKAATLALEANEAPVLPWSRSESTKPKPAGPEANSENRELKDLDVTIKVGDLDRTVEI